MPVFLNLIGFQIGWFACVLGASRGHWWVGPVVVGLFVAANRALVGSQAATPPLRPWALMLAGVTGLGFVVDSTLSAAGLLSLAANPLPGWLSAPWMAALWLNFGLTLDSSLAWLQGRTLLAALLGAAGGPLAYWAGERLGAVQLAGLPALATVAVCWAVAVPLTSRWAAGLSKGARA